MPEERIEQQEVPADLAERIALAGGKNRFGEPLFRVVWGFSRIVKIHGTWEEWGTYEAKLIDRLTGAYVTRKFQKLERSVVETREMPKYLPGNAFHLEKWVAPEMYGTPEAWQKAGAEQSKFLTVYTSGPFPSMGEYELAVTLTDNGCFNGQPVPLNETICEFLVGAIRAGGERFTFAQNRQAIMQREEQKKKWRLSELTDELQDGMPAMASRPFVTVASPSDKALMKEFATKLGGRPN